MRTAFIRPAEPYLHELGEYSTLYWMCLDPLRDELAFASLFGVQ